jgi:hypothetical protein
VPEADILLLHSITSSASLRAMPPAQLAKFITDETEKWAKLVKFVDGKLD